LELYGFELKIKICAFDASAELFLGQQFSFPILLFWNIEATVNMSKMVQKINTPLINVL
jgi:hypothetical protein